MNKTAMRMKVIDWAPEEGQKEIRIGVLEFHPAKTSENGFFCSSICPWLQLSEQPKSRAIGPMDHPSAYCQWYGFLDIRLLITGKGPSDIAEIVRPEECKQAEVRGRGKQE